MHGVRKNERYNQRGGGVAKQYPTSYSNKWATDTKRMAKRKKEKRAEIRKRD